MITAMATARSGMLASVARLEASASNIANGVTAGIPRPEAAQPAPFVDADGSDRSVDLAQEAVGVLQASLLFKANLAVLKTADAMMRRMLDIRA